MQNVKGHLKVVPNVTGEAIQKLEKMGFEVKVVDSLQKRVISIQPYQLVAVYHKDGVTPKGYHVINLQQKNRHSYYETLEAATAVKNLLNSNYQVQQRDKDTKK